MNNGIRYYRCHRHMPRDAKLLGKSVCHLPDLHANDLEAELWRVLDTTLFDDATLDDALAAARDQHDHADGLRHDRLAAIDAEIARQRKRLQALVDELIDAGPLGKDAIRQRMKEAETLITRLDGEAAQLRRVPGEGVSAENEAEIRAAVALARAGLALMTDAQRGDFLDRIRLRATVYAAPADDDDAVRIGRKHRFRIDWGSVLRLSDSGQDKCSPARQ